MLMPFGKYKGAAVDELPEDYLFWLLQNVELNGALRIAVLQTLGIDATYYDHLEARIAQLEATNDQLRREISRLTDSAHDAQSPPHTITAAVLDRKYRQFALKYHPDRGGDGVFMVIINEVFDELRQGLVK